MLQIHPLCSRCGYKQVLLVLLPVLDTESQEMCGEYQINRKKKCRMLKAIIEVFPRNDITGAEKRKSKYTT